MTREQIDDVAKAARVAAISQAIKHGNRCVFAIVVAGLDVGAPMAIASNLVDPAKPEDITRVLQNGIRAIQNNPGGGKTSGGLILLSVLALIFGVLAGVVASGCGSVEASYADAQTADPGSAGVRGGAGTAGGADGAVSAGMGGGGAAGSGGAAGAGTGSGGGGAAAASGGDGGATLGTAGAGGGIAGVTGAAGGGGLTGAAGAGADAGLTCVDRVTGAICYQCPAPAPTCGVPNRGAWLCCDKGGAPSCDLGWCRQ